MGHLRYELWVLIGFILFWKIIVGPGPDRTPQSPYMYGEGFQVGKIWGGGTFQDAENFIHP